jgi:tetratricopeptide (TPR) repeat protein
MRMRTWLVIFSLALLVQAALAQSQDAALRFRLAQSYEQAGEYERAVDLYRDLNKSDPANYVYFDALQRTLAQLKRYDDAIALIRQRLMLSPGDLNLQAMLGTALYRSGRENEGFDAWERAIAPNPANPQAYRLIANVMTENRLLERAADVYRRARSGCNDPNLFTLELAQILIVSMDYAGATAEMLRWFDQNPLQIVFVQSRLATFAWKPDGRSAAINVVRSALRTREQLRLYELLGWLYLEGREFEPALEAYRTIDRLSNAQGASLLAFADRLSREHAYEIAAAAYREALNQPLASPRIPQAKYGYACTLMELRTPRDTTEGASRIGRFPISESRLGFEGVLASFNAIIADHPTTEYAVQSYYQIGMIHFRRFFDLDNAARAFEHILTDPAARNTQRYDALLRLGEILTARGDTGSAAVRFQQVSGAPDATPDQSDEGSFHLAELEYFRNRFDDALRILSTISTNTKADYANDALQLQAFLEENSRTAPEPLKLFSQAEFLGRQKKNTEAIQIFRDILSRFSGAPLADDALMRTGALLTEAAMYRDAIASYERLLTDYKENGALLDRARFHIGEIYQYGLQNTPEAISAYEKLLAEFPQSVLVHVARKRIRMLRGDVL